LTVALFLFWVLLGRALLALLPGGRPALQDWLLAPPVGLALTLLLVFQINRLGVPVGSFAPWLTAGLALASLLTLWRLRPALPWRSAWPFAGVLLLGLCLVGRPLWEFGFDWVSVCNEDTANYCTGGERVLRHGFLEVPDEATLVGGLDYTQCYWFMHVPGCVRPGSELVLAWVAALTGLSCLEAFMVTILGFHLVLIAAGGALVLRSEALSWPALLTCALLALSALTSLGALLQLIAQVIGLALLAGTVAVLFRPTAGMKTPEALRTGGLAGVLLTALALAYPEVLPFLGVALLAHLLLGFRRRTLAARPLLVGAAVALAVLLVWLGRYAHAPLTFFASQTHVNTTPEARRFLRETFPFYLLPSGPACLWGLLSCDLGTFTRERWLTGKILLGALLLLAGALATGWQARRREPAALLGGVMLAVGLVLFLKRDAFGLFKLAMFIQPFLLGAVALAACALFRRRALQAAPLLLLAALGLAQQRAYVENSRGTEAAFSQVPDASRSRLLRAFKEAVEACEPRRILLDSFSPPLIKLQALYLRGVQTMMPRGSFYTYVVPRSSDAYGRDLSLLAPRLVQATLTLREAWDRQECYDVRHNFRLYDPKEPGGVNEFMRNHLGFWDEGAGAFVARSGPRLGVLNRRHFALGEERGVVLTRYDEVKNHLLLIISQREGRTLADSSGGLALHSLERDVLFPGRTMAGCGRHLLFEVVNPTPGARLLLDVHTTLKADGDNALPPAVAIGDRRLPFPILGRGSARVFSPPLTPQQINGLPYLGLDMQVEPRVIPYRRSGLMALYGKDLPLDRRLLVGFVRDISLVSQEDYARLRPPARLEKFPGDLQHPDLEYSGIYEDGWVSEASFFRLAQGPGDRLVVRGLLPLIKDPGFTTQLRVLVDGKLVAARQLRPGPFEVAADVPGAGTRRVELHFSAHQQLPGGDGRPFGARLDCVGFVGASPGTRRGGV
jgi:hypothetical protein